MRLFWALLAGLLFGAGLALSGMTNTEKVLGFLDLAGDWDPSLAFVMGGALLVTLVLTPLVIARGAPLIGGAFALPTRSDVDWRLIGGGVLFGVGWGLWGYCPGPALAALSYGQPSTVVFVICMFVGMWLAGRTGLAR